MKIKHFASAWLLSGMLFSSVISSKAQVVPFTSAQIDSIVGVSMNLMPHAGMAVLVVKDGKIVHAKGYGFASVDSKQKVDEHTRFAIASNSKAFTSSALAILVDQQKIKWNDKVVDYVPEFKMYDPYVTANFTILDLLTHRSGLGLGAGDLMFFPDGGKYTITDVLKSFQYQTPVSDFRTKYDYDNLLYVVAGEVIARVSGLSWSEFVETNIMKPLEMNESAGTIQRLSNKTNIAYPHAVQNGVVTQLQPMDIELGAAAAGIYASISDLSNWITMHLNDGKFDSETLISRNSHQEMWKPHTNMSFSAKTEAPYFSHFTAYGLGWQLGDVGGKVVVSHTGGLPGMLSKTTLIPELNVGIVVLTNCDPGGYSFHSIAGIIADSYIGVKGIDWIKRVDAAIKYQNDQNEKIVGGVWKTVDSVKSQSINTKLYTGMYKDDWFGEIEISARPKQLSNATGKKSKKMQLNEELYINCLKSPKLQGTLHFYKANTFAVKWDYQDMPCDAFVMFTLDENGKASGFKVKGISPNIDFSFDFQDLDVKRIE